MFSKDVANNHIYEYSMSFAAKNKFQITLLLTKIKFDQKFGVFCSFLIKVLGILYVFSNNLTK